MILGKKKFFDIFIIKKSTLKSTFFNNKYKTICIYFNLDFYYIL
jgi:hypothetical protein